MRFEAAPRGACYYLVIVLLLLGAALSAGLLREPPAHLRLGKTTPAPEQEAAGPSSTTTILGRFQAPPRTRMRHCAC